MSHQRVYHISCAGARRSSPPRRYPPLEITHSSQLGSGVLVSASKFSLRGIISGAIFPEGGGVISRIRLCQVSVIVVGRGMSATFLVVLLKSAKRKNRHLRLYLISPQCKSFPLPTSRLTRHRNRITDCTIYLSVCPGPAHNSGIYSSIKFKLDVQVNYVTCNSRTSFSGQKVKVQGYEVNILFIRQMHYSC